MKLAVSACRARDFADAVLRRRDETCRGTTFYYGTTMLDVDVARLAGMAVG